MGNMRLLAGFPWWFGENVRVGATVHDLRHLFPEAAADLLACCVKTLVFNRVVKQGGDGLILVAAVFQYDAGDPEQVGNVRDIGAFAQLVGVKLRSIYQGFLETGRKNP